MKSDLKNEIIALQCSIVNKQGIIKGNLEITLFLHETCFSLSPQSSQWGNSTERKHYTVKKSLSCDRYILSKKCKQQWGP